MIVTVPKYHRIGEGFTRREVVDANEHPGRRTDGTQTAATWITHLADLRKTLLFCQFCRAKFDPKRHRYRRWYVPDHTGRTDSHTVNGRCDACKQQTAGMAGGGACFVPEETYNLVNVDPVTARRKARQTARAAWAASWWRRLGSRAPKDGAAEMRS